MWVALGLGLLGLCIKMALDGTELEDVFDVMMAVFSGFQGAFVSFFVCFSNSEVHAVVKRRWTYICWNFLF